MSSASPKATESIGSPAEIGVTRALADWLVTLPREEVSTRALRCARHALLDWTGVTIAARDDPLVDVLVGDAMTNGEIGTVPLVGRSENLSPVFAALVNGAASHALDFDDVNSRVHGHPSVAIVPALLAAASSNEASMEELLEAFVVGTEIACGLGEILGAVHYDRGFHATATVGCVSAAGATARLMNLDAERALFALGLGATQAAGLKASFGTMAKPLHAGRSAMSGLLAARWAAAGLTAAPDAIEAEQGMVAAMTAELAPMFMPPAGVFGIELNCYKYYPACYFTHSAIAATEALRDEHNLKPDDVDQVRIGLQPQHDKVCNIAEPQDGLGIKFSVRHLVAMALARVEVGDIHVYEPKTAVRQDLVDLRERIAFVPMDVPTRRAARIEIVCRNGSVLARDEDIAIPARDLNLQEERLQAKFRALTNPVLGKTRAGDLAGAILSGGADLGIVDLLEMTREGSRA